MRLQKIAESKLTVTVLGGIIVAGVGAFLKGYYTSKERETARQESLHLKKLDPLVASCHDFERGVTLLGDLRAVKIRLLEETAVAPQTQPSGQTRLVRSKEELVHLNEQLRTEYLESKTPNTVLTEIKVLFKSPQVQAQIDPLFAEIVDMQQAPDARAITSSANRIMKDFQSLADTMGKELAAPD